MIAVDTNILVYAHRAESECHEAAKSAMKELTEGRATWAIPWPCVHEFFSVVTNKRVFSTPTPLQGAIDQIEVWIDSPTILLLSEPESYWSELKTILLNAPVMGPMVHDARIAALCQLHGVRELWSTDRDFTRFRELNMVNPLLR